MKSAHDFIPIAAPDLDEGEERYVVDAIRSSWISSSGHYVRTFEARFAEACNVKLAASIVNGTAALHLAVEALGLKPGDEVIVPALTYVATANAVRYAQGVPVFVDVDPATWCIDPGRIEAAMSPKTKGIIAVDIYGHPADMDRIMQIASRHRLWVIEDAAEAHFARYRGRVTGGLADVGVFSFYGNKIVTCGEGGAITTNDADIDRRVRLLRNQGMDPERRYFFPVIGYNYRLTNIACALLCAQLEKRERLINRRREIYRRYWQRLEGIAGVGLQPAAPWAEVTPWLFCVTIDEERFGRTRDELIGVLQESGIETRPFFIPIHLLPPYAAGPPSDRFPEAERLGATGLNLPTFTGMSDAQIEHVCATLASARRHRG
ncbi:MAG: DegT/DnrJ/EryC1/StrS family aminotransferase [Steroidobacteraceae bacterium]